MSNITLINASCVEQNVDAIVNAANRNLLSGGGVCDAIFAKAGYAELTEACRKYQAPLLDGDAVITPAFNIKNAKYIIHAVGPDFAQTPDGFDKLFDAYYIKSADGKWFAFNCFPFNQFRDIWWKFRKSISSFYSAMRKSILQIHFRFSWI